MNKTLIKITRWTALMGLAVNMLFAGTAHAFVWAGPGDPGATNDWNVGANWLGGVVPDTTGGTTFSDGGYATISATLSSPNIGELDLGAGGGVGQGTVLQTAGALYINSWFNIGANGGGDASATYDISGGLLVHVAGGNFQVGAGGTGTNALNIHGTGVVTNNSGGFGLGEAGNYGVNYLNILDDGVLVHAVSSDFNVGDANSAGVGNVSTLTISNNGALYSSANFFGIGHSGYASGTVNLAGGTFVHTGGNQLSLGQGSPNALGTLNVNGGKLQLTGGASILVGDGSSSTGLVTVASGVIDHSTGGGILNIGSTWVGAINQTGGFVTNTTGDTLFSSGGSGQGTWNLSGGVARVNFMHLGNGSSNPANLNVSAGGVFISQQTIEMGAGNGNSTNTINLDGGTLSANGIQADANNNATSLQVINFNGGVLQSLANNGNYLNGSGHLQVNVLAGGLTFDDGGNADTITNALSGVGGLTKQGGAGTLTLTGNNTYQGLTVVNNGELISPTAVSSANSSFTINSPATNGIQLTAVNGQWRCAGLTYGTGTPSTDFNFGSVAPSTTTAPILVSGNLAFNGTPNVIIRGTAVTSLGQYPLIKYTGTLSGTPPTAPFSVPGSVVTAVITNNTANKSIDLIVTAINGIVYTFSPTNAIGAIVGSNAVVTLSVSASATASGPYTVTLTSGTPTVTANQTITLPQGITSTNLSFPILAVGVSTVTASGPGSTPANLTVTGSLPTITVLPVAIGASFGSNAVVTLTLTNVNNFPFSGLYTVTLTSGNTSVTPSQSLTLPSGVISTNISFLITGAGVSTVTATGTGLNQATVQVTGAVPSIVLPASAFANVGGNANATLTITNQFPFSGPYTVTLTSGNPAVTANQTLVIPAGVVSTNVTFLISSSGSTTVTASGSGLNSASINVGDYNTVFATGLANQWVGNDYVSGNNWTDRVENVVAQLDGTFGNAFPPVIVPGGFGTNQGVQIYPGAGIFGAGFSIPSTNPPTGLTNYTVSVVLFSPTAGPGGGAYYQNQLIIGYDIGGSGQPDWGMSWGGPNFGGKGVTAGIGFNGGDQGLTTSGALSLSSSHAIAMQTSGNNIFRLYVDGTLVGQATGLSLRAPANSNPPYDIPLLSTVGANIGSVFTNTIAEVRIYTNTVDGAALTTYLSNLYQVWAITLPTTVNGSEGGNAFATLTVPAAATASGPATITLTSDNQAVTAGLTVTLPQGSTSTNLSLFITGVGIAHVTATGLDLIAATVTVNGIAVVPEIWTPVYNNTWDINTTANWLLSGSPGNYIDGSTVQFDDTGSAQPDVSIQSVVVPANVIVSNSAVSYSFSGAPIGGTSGLLKLGGGSLTISNANTYTGDTVISNGNVNLAAPAGIPSGTVAYYTFNNPAILGADSSGQGNTLITASGSPAYSANGEVGGSLYLDGASSLTTSGFPSGVPIGASAYSVAVLEKADVGCPNNGGFVGWGNNGGNLCNNLRLNGPNSVADYWFGNDFALSGLAVNPLDGNWHSIVATWDGTTQTIYVDGVSVGSRSATAPSVVAANFIVGKTTADTFFNGWVDNLLIANRALTPGEVSGYAGNASLPWTTSVKIGGSAALALNGNVQTIGSLAGSAGASVTLGGGALITGGNNSSTAFAGTISGAGSVTKTGTNLFILSGANTYSGGTVVSAGILDVQHDGGLGTGDVSVENAVLKLELGASNTYISSNASLMLTDPASVNLAFTGSDVITNLVINGVQQAAGTWGSSSSGAANVDNVHFSGTGKLQVGLALPPPSSPTILPVYRDNTGANLVFRVATQAGYNYYLLSTTNLTPTIHWVTNTITAGTGGIITNTAAIQPAQPQIFFRYQVGQ